MKDTTMKLIMIAIAIGGFISGYTCRDMRVTAVEFEYSSLDEYYLECMSLHRGTGRVIIYSNKEYELLCADGHKAGDPRHSVTGLQNFMGEKDGK